MPNPCGKDECETCGECASEKQTKDPQRAAERDPEGTEPRGLPYLFDRREMPRVSLDDPFHSQR